jgi:prepilin-type N-terminal cleavage/methylation domain-containing protein
MSDPARERIKPAAGTAGFTLLEVLISIFLLVVISAAIYQATTQTFRLRDVLQNEGDFYNGIRLSMGVIDRDVSLLFSPVIMLPPKKKDPNQPAGGTGQGDAPLTAAELQEREEIQNQGLDRATAFWGGMLDKTGLRPSRFVGAADKLTFVSASHIRIYKEARESDFAKVTYELQSDRDNPGAKLLVRLEDPNVFDDEEKLASRYKSRRTYPLLRGVKKLVFAYYRRDKERWEARWDSDSQDTKNKYPDAVRVQLEVTGPARLSFEGTYQFKPEIPLDGLKANL